MAFSERVLGGRGVMSFVVRVFRMGMGASFVREQSFVRRNLCSTFCPASTLKRAESGTAPRAAHRPPYQENYSDPLANTRFVPVPISFGSIFGSPNQRKKNASLEERGGGTLRFREGSAAQTASTRLRTAMLNLAPSTGSRQLGQLSDTARAWEAQPAQKECRQGRSAMQRCICVRVV